MALQIQAKEFMNFPHSKLTKNLCFILILSVLLVPDVEIFGSSSLAEGYDLKSYKFSLKIIETGFNLLHSFAYHKFSDVNCFRNQLI